MNKSDQKTLMTLIVFLRKLSCLLAFNLIIFVSLNNEALAQKAKKAKKSKKASESVIPAEEPVRQKLQPVKEGSTEREATPEKEEAGIDIKIINDHTLVLGDQKYEYEPVAFNTPNGQIDYSNQVIKAKGMSVIDSERFKNPAQARAMAIQGARADAQRKLLETVQGVQVIAETSVRDMITESDVVNTKVQGVLKGAIMVGEPEVKDGLVEVTMQIGMYGEGSLANALYDDLINKDYRARTSGQPDKNDPASMTLASSQQEEQEDVADRPKNEQQKQLVFNLNGQRIDPSMFPVLVDEKGKILLDMTKVYDPKKGKFPKYLQLGKDLMSDLGMKKEVEMVNVLESTGGKLVVDSSKSKINWAKVGSTLGKIGKFLLLLL